MRIVEKAYYVRRKGYPKARVLKVRQNIDLGMRIVLMEPVYNFSHRAYIPEGTVIAFNYAYTRITGTKYYYVHWASVCSPGMCNVGRALKGLCPCGTAQQCIVDTNLDTYIEGVGRHVISTSEKDLALNVLLHLRSMKLYYHQEIFTKEKRA
jgi:hypothetical protein